MLYKVEIKLERLFLKYFDTLPKFGSNSAKIHTKTLTGEQCRALGRLDSQGHKVNVKRSGKGMTIIVEE